jgi:hypothetical protein
MKKTILAILVIQTFGLGSPIQGQGTKVPSIQVNTVSVYVSTLMGTFVNISYDQNYIRKHGIVGFTTGFTIFPGAGYGPHLALNLMAGKKNHHLETKFGGVLLFDRVLWTYPDEYKWVSQPIPVITLGYRYQKPEGGWIFRFAVSTGGIGAGLGYAFVHHKKPKSE